MKPDVEFLGVRHPGEKTFGYRSPAGTEKRPAKCVSKTLTADVATVFYELRVPEAWTKPARK